MSERDLPAALFQQEFSLLEARYKTLKERDQANWERVVKLFVLLLIYTSAPFALEDFQTGGSILVRLWCMGGAFVTIIISLMCDRDFRAYGLHLKERIYCLTQLSILRGLAAGVWPDYKASTLLPMWELYRKGDRSGFPEYIEPRQILSASRAFKMITAFPLLYCIFFCLVFLFPGVLFRSAQSAASALTLETLCRGPFFCSGLIFLWIHVSSRRCMNVQKAVFEARRVSVERPWPLFPVEGEVNASLPKHHRARGRLLTFAIATLSVLNLALGIAYSVRDVDPTWFWEPKDRILSLVTGCLLILFYRFSEDDIELRLLAAKEIFPR
jgi:hypothetical protein